MILTINITDSKKCLLSISLNICDLWIMIPKYFFRIFIKLAILTKERLHSAVPRGREKNRWSWKEAQTTHGFVMSRKDFNFWAIVQVENIQLIVPTPDHKYFIFLNCNHAAQVQVADFETFDHTFTAKITDL